MQKAAPETKRPVPAAIDLGAYRIADPETFGRNMLRLMEEGQKAMSGFLERANGGAGPYSMASEMTDAVKLFSEIAQPWVAEPAKLVEAQGALIGSYMQLVASLTTRAMGGEAMPVVEPETGDNRFNDPEWSRNPYFDFWKQIGRASCRERVYVSV